MKSDLDPLFTRYISRTEIQALLAEDAALKAQASNPTPEASSQSSQASNQSPEVADQKPENPREDEDDGNAAAA